MQSHDEWYKWLIDTGLMGGIHHAKFMALQDSHWILFMSNTTPSPETNAQEILEKYDRESVTRNGLSKTTNYIITAIAIAYSIFHLYITFNPLPELIQRSVHVAVGVGLIFLIYPATKKSVRNKVALIDWVWLIASFSTAGYLIW